MRLSRMVGARIKETPNDAVLKSHQFLIRGGYIRQLSTGIYSLLPIALRVVQKIEKIIRDEMNFIGGQEVLMPVVMPKEIWEESGRYQSIGGEMVRFQDRTENHYVLGMTHEEAVVALARSEVGSYKNYPFMLYQIQTKFRDEKRSRGGLVRVREFTMKDAYSFHTSMEDLLDYYAVVYASYSRIFERVGLKDYVVVEADPGMMGSGVSHEYMKLTPVGEDSLVICQKCDYAANREVGISKFSPIKGASSSLKKVATPDKKSIEEVSEFLGVTSQRIAKAVLYQVPSTRVVIFCLIRGDREINEIKVAKIADIREPMVLASEEVIRGVGIEPGYATPMALTADPKKLMILVDHTVIDDANLVTGANEKDFHYCGFEPRRDLDAGYQVVDICHVEEADTCSKCGGTLTLSRGIEIGNIFQLGAKYTASMGMTYHDPNGKSATPIMGCYGIGVGRLMASAIEESHDDYGPIWPVNIAPYAVHINALNYNKEEIKQVADQLYSDLEAAGVEVLLDDTNNKAGFQFADADLIGVPLRLIISPKNLAAGVIEWKLRDGTDKGTWSVTEVFARTQEMIVQLKKRAEIPQ